MLEITEFFEISIQRGADGGSALHARSTTMSRPAATPKTKKPLPRRETGGPLIQTGPRAGQVRTRTKDGRWRRKRSDAGVPRGPHKATPAS